MRTLFTVVHYHQIHRVIQLAESLQKHQPQDTLQIWIADQNQGIDLPVWAGVTWHFINEIPENSWHDMSNRYSWEVFRENMKPFVGHYLLEKFNQILYVDPYCVFFQPFAYLWDAADQAQMVLIPELLEAEGHPKQEKILNQGIYQNHIWVAQKTADSDDFFAWWKEQVLLKGFVDVCHGMNADRYYLEIAPSIFPNFTIYKHPGVGVSNRNLAERKINWFQRTANDYPLVSYEFEHESEYPASVQPTMSRAQRQHWNAIRPSLGLPELSRRQQKMRTSLLNWEARIHRFFNRF